MRKIAINLTSLDGAVDIAMVDMVQDIDEAMILLADLWGRADLAHKRLNETGSEADCK